MLGVFYLFFYHLGELGSYHHKITITLRSYVVVLSVTFNCGFSRGDVRLILDGWLVEEYRVHREYLEMLMEIGTALCYICASLSHEFGLVYFRVKFIILGFLHQLSRQRAYRMIMGMIACFAKKSRKERDYDV